MIPAYRAEDTVRAAVESALAQTLAQLEVIVVDDCSPEPVAGALEGVDDPRLRVIRLPRNRGTGTARNAALRAARSELVSQLDADDLWDPRYLERVRPRFEDPGVGVVYTNARLIGHLLRYHQIGAHKPQHLSRIERQPDNPGIAARTKDLREQVLLESHPSAWRLVTSKEMRFPPSRQQLLPVIWLSIVWPSIVRRHNLTVRRDEVSGRQFRNRRRTSLRVVRGDDI